METALWTPWPDGLKSGKFRKTEIRTVSGRKKQEGK